MKIVVIIITSILLLLIIIITIITIIVRLEADLHEVPEVVAEGLHGDVQGEVGLAEEEDGQQQEHADAEGHLNMLYYIMYKVV